MASAYSQQRPQYSQYIQNYFLINPAAAGIEKNMNITMSYRKQWVGLSGSPSTSILTMNTSLHKSKSVDNFSEEQNKNQMFTLGSPHHALGFTVINDAAGALNRLVANATYAYHLQLGSKLNLSAGISGGFSTISILQKKLSLENEVDPAVYNYSGKGKLDLNSGILLYGEQFFAGISVQQIIPTKVTTNGNQISLYGDRKFPDLFISGGTRFKINSDLNFLPSVMVKYISNIPVTFDLNAKIDYKDQVWAGYSYRYKSGMAAFAGLRLSDDIKFGYAYDFTTSGLQRVSRGTHELLLGFTVRRSWWENRR